MQFKLIIFLVIKKPSSAQMKPLKNKKKLCSKNSSFMSNQDLLQNFRNKSLRNLPTQPSRQISVNLIPKKTFKQFESNKRVVGIEVEDKQNNSRLANKYSVGQSPSKIFIQIDQSKKQNPNSCMFRKIIKQLNFVKEQIPNENIQLKILLNKNIQKLQNIKIDNHQFVDLNKNQTSQLYVSENETNRMMNMNNDNKYLTAENLSLKNQLKTCKQLLRTYEQQKKTFNKEKTQFHTKEIQKPKKYDKNEAKDSKQIRMLQRMVINQGQLINKQCLQFKNEQNQMMRMLKLQSEKIQELILKKPIQSVKIMQYK